MDHSDLLSSTLVLCGKYSGTSHNGPSERRTTSAQRTKSVARIEITTAIIHSQPPRNGRFSIPDSGKNWRSITAFSLQNCLETAEAAPIKLTLQPPCAMFDEGSKVTSKNIARGCRRSTGVATIF